MKRCEKDFKTRKKIAAFGRVIMCAAAAVLLLFCTACKKGEPTVSLSADEIASQIIGNVSFDDGLKQMTEDYARKMFKCDGCTDVVYYCETGAVADQLAVFAVKSPNDEKQLVENLNVYVEGMTEEYNKYAPAEAMKLSNAVLLSEKNRVVLCVTADYEAARGIIKNALSGKILEQNTTEAANGTVNTGESTISVSKTTVESSKATTAESTTAVVQQTEKYPYIEQTGDFQDLGNIVRSGDSCFECLYYNADCAKRYAQGISSLAEKAGDKAHVYYLIAPLSSAITLPDSLREKIKSADQNDAINKVYSQLSGKVTPVRVYNKLMQHRDEYVYFRTDHHWTALGAYYAFTKFLSAKGLKAHKLKEYTSVSYSGFLGSFYEESGKSKALEAKPDTLTAYYPLGNDSIKMSYTDKSGESFSWPVINNVTSYVKSLKYCAFIGGDNPYTELVNSAVTDDSCCVVIKESFGNAFVPFLADIYHKVRVVDYRYYTGSLSKLISAQDNTDVLFLSNASALQNQYLAGKFDAVSAS